jgi:hypothetical protein
MNPKRLVGLMQASLLAMAGVSVAVGASIVNDNRALADELSFGGEAVSGLGDVSQLKVSRLRASGLGAFVFNQSLTQSVGDSSSHALSFALSDGSSLEYVVYGDSKLESGLTVRFERQNKSLLVQLIGPSALAQTVDVSKSFEWVDASRIIDLQMDVHNDESPTHVLIWDGLERSFNEENAKFNSEEMELPSFGQSPGAFRGFVLNKATVFKAVTSEPKFKHEH